MLNFFVGPDLGIICLQRLPAEDKRHWRAKSFEQTNQWIKSVAKVLLFNTNKSS